jgi:hypothetical protein
VSATFDTLGFPARYSVAVEPDERDGASYAYGRNGKLIEEYDFDARWGTPMVLRIGPDTGPAWTGAFAAGGLGTVRNVYATPSPKHVCAIVDGLAYVVDVDTPDQPAFIAANAVVTVLPVPDVPLLVLAGDTDLAGIRDDGIVWAVPRLVLDDLRVLRANAEAIVCSGDIGGRMATITVTPTSGTIWGSDYR